MNIHVTNLPPETSLMALRGWFEKFGIVSNVTISTYSVGGEPRALASVEMPSFKYGRAAIDGLQGTALAGKTLALREE